MNILVVNQHNSDNIGDKLIGISIFDFFMKKKVRVHIAGFAQTDIQEISCDTKKSYSLLPILKQKFPASLKYLLVYKKKIRNEAKKYDIENIDALIIGGGQLIKHGSVFPYCFRDWIKIAKTRGIKVYIYGIGVDDNLTARDRKYYSEGFEIAKLVSCRDKESAAHLQHFVKREVEVWPDVAFSYSVNCRTKDKDSLLIMPYNYDVARVHFASLNSRESYYCWILERINALNYKKIILSATTSADLKECYLLQDYLKEKRISCDIKQVKNIEELVELYESTKLLISGRMHALIVGALCGIDTEAIEISPKIIDYKNDVMKNGNSIEKIKKMSLAGLDRLWEALVFEENNE